MKLDFTPFPEIITERLLLRQLSLDDLEPLFSLRTNSEVNQYIKRPTLKNQEEVAKFITKINLGIDQNESMYWAITQKKNPILIGTVCLWKFSAESDSAEIGYELDPEYQQRGIMSEVIPAIVQLGFTRFNLNHIEAFTHRENQASIKLLEKNKFLLDKKLSDKENLDNIVFVLRAQATR